MMMNDLIERLRGRTLAKHGGPSGPLDGWNLSDLDSELHVEAATEIERLNRLLFSVRNAFNRECDDLDAILHVLGLSPDNCRTDGGSLMLQDVLGKINHREAALRYEARLHKDRADDCGRLARMVLEQECLSDEPQSAVAAAYGGLVQTSQG